MIKNFIKLRAKILFYIILVLNFENQNILDKSKNIFKLLYTLSRKFEVHFDYIEELTEMKLCFFPCGKISWQFIV